MNKKIIVEKVALTDEQKAELDCRLDAYHKNSEEGSPWKMVKDRISPSICISRKT